MKKLIALIALCSFANSHAYTGTWNDPLRPFDATKNTQREVKIQWIVVDDVVKACNAESRKHGLPPIGPLTACSFWWGETCKIYTAKQATMHEVGHEVRHCFQGAWH